jgi:ABC-type transport system involved in multi-copper enzyme maturation permease subunit
MYARRYLRRRSVVIVILLANIPTVVGAVLLYLIGQGKQIGPLSDALPNINMKLARPFVDNFLTATAILAAIIGPSAIAGERRAGGVVFHLIRPMTGRELLLGHWLAVSAVLCATGLVPLVALFLFGRLVLPASLLGALPWSAGLRVLGVGAVASALVGLVVIAISASAGNSRGAFLVWLLSYFGSKIAMDVLRAAKVGEVVRCLSLPDVLKQFAAYALEGTARFEGCGPWWMLVFAAIVAAAVVSLTRGVSAVERT